ncbi:MAG: cysteine desulfurase [Chitinophagales bacterium]|nr:cysteine desulfurase [Chitinophagales bacterium]
MIYLDYNATTPVDEKVLQAMLPYFTTHFGNAASATHTFGWIAKDVVETARNNIAQHLNCSESEIIFTSGATESLNLAIKGIYERYQTKGNHIITCKTEHNAVLDTCKYLETKGATISYLSVDENGLINLDELEKCITDKTILVAIMLANNETGVIQPIQDIAKITHQKNTILCCDATQALGKIPVDVQQLNVDVMAFSGHKMYAPKGIGALYIRRRNPRVTLTPLLHGGGHEKSYRSGTLNVPAIVGLSKAVDIISFDNQLATMRNDLENKLLDKFGDKIKINGINAPRLPNTSNILFPIDAVDIIKQIKMKVAVSTGSACTSAENKPSHVLTAMHLTEQEAKKCIRFSFGKYNTMEDVEQVLTILSNTINID